MIEILTNIWFCIFLSISIISVCATIVSLRVGENKFNSSVDKTTKDNKG